MYVILSSIIIAQLSLCLGMVTERVGGPSLGHEHHEHHDHREPGAPGNASGEEELVVAKDASKTSP